MPVITAVVFDLDDTLYPEREFAFSGFAAVAAAYEEYFGNRPAAEHEMKKLFDTGHRGRVFNQMLARRGIADDEKLVRTMIETYHTHRPAISLHPDAASALTRLRESHKLGLISDGPAAMQASKIDALALHDKLDTIVLTDQLGPGMGKPHPRAYETVAARLGVEPACCVYVADNPTKDFVAPNALGWLSIQIIRQDGVYRDRPPAKDGQPQHVITTLDSLKDVLG